MKIPQKSADEIIFISDRKCCICKASGQQIHHIDGNPNNNSLDNLAYMCFDHHDEAEKRGGFSRGLTPGVIRKYRDQHIRKAGFHRDIPKDKSEREVMSKEEYFELFCDAIIARDILRELEKLTPEWQNLEALLGIMNISPYRIGFFAKKSILEAINDVVENTRYGLPKKYINDIETITINMTPPFNYNRKRQTPLSEEDKTLLHYCSMIGGALVYDGALDLKSIPHARAGSYLLSHALRLASVNECVSLKKLILEEYMTAEDGCKRSGLKELYQLVSLEKKAALKNKKFPPIYPENLRKMLLLNERKFNSIAIDSFNNK